MKRIVIIIACITAIGAACYGSLLNPIQKSSSTKALVVIRPGNYSAIRVQSTANTTLFLNVSTAAGAATATGWPLAKDTAHDFEFTTDKNVKTMAFQHTSSATATTYYYQLR